MKEYDPAKVSIRYAGEEIVGFSKIEIEREKLQATTRNNPDIQPGAVIVISGGTAHDGRWEIMTVEPLGFCDLILNLERVEV